jgi:hypothetical protein
MHYIIDYIRRADNHCFHIDKVIRREDGTVLGRIGSQNPWPLTRIKMNRFISSHYSDEEIKLGWKLKIY